MEISDQNNLKPLEKLYTTEDDVTKIVLALLDNYPGKVTFLQPPQVVNEDHTTTVISGEPGGSDTQIQFNDGGGIWGRCRFYLE